MIFYPTWHPGDANKAKCTNMHHQHHRYVKEVSQVSRVTLKRLTSPIIFCIM